MKVGSILCRKNHFLVWGYFYFSICSRN